MLVNHSGWNIEHGYFNYNIFVDENKTDYEIRFKSGKFARQIKPFEELTMDWNHDGDTYALFGAYFRNYDRNGSPESVDFWTPEDMIRGLLGDSFTYDKIISIPGIELPAPEKRYNRPSLDEQIYSSEKRAMAQDIERNRKMNSLGYRPYNEPWAR